MVGNGEKIEILIGFDFYQPNNVTANARAYIRSYYSELNDEINELGNGFSRVWVWVSPISGKFVHANYMSTLLCKLVWMSFPEISLAHFLEICQKGFTI